MSQQKLILLFGLPRSGTTWIGKLFDSHKDTFYLHEPDSVLPNFNIPLILNNDNNENILTESIEKWLKVNDEKVIASRPVFKKSYLNIFQYQIFVLTTYLSKLSSKLKLPFFKKPIRLQSKPPIHVWKSVESLGRLKQIKKLANAHSIQILRHPCGHVASIMRGEKQDEFDSNTPTYEDWDLFDKLIKQSDEQRFSLDDIKQLSPEERLAFRWGVLNDSALLQEKDIENIKQSIVLVYEDLCREPEKKLKSIFSNVGLSFTEETRDFIKVSTGSDDNAYYATKKTPLTAAYRWKEELSVEQISNIENMVKYFKSGAYYQEDF